MAKGDDAVRRKRNRSQRKKMRNDSSSVSARVASIIAAKHRRKTGKRRICEGMCFGLPTPEDPFNDRNGKKVSHQRKQKKQSQKHVDVVTNLPKKGSEVAQNLLFDQDTAVMEKLKKACSIRKDEQSKLYRNYHQMATKKQGNLKVSQLKESAVTSARKGLHSDCISKFLILCLNAIQDSWRHDGIFDENSDKPLLANGWGVEFWKCCSAGADIRETMAACSSPEQIAWLVSSAADIIARKEKEGQIISCPFLLFIVPSQEKAIKVRSICKPLKALGIHTVSVHSGASVDHQVMGLKSCEPEFVVATPGRLLELVSLKAIDISCVSLMVVDGLESFVDDATESIKSVRQCISGEPQIIIFGNYCGDVSISLVQNLSKQPLLNLSQNDSLTA